MLRRPTRGSISRPAAAAVALALALAGCSSSAGDRARVDLPPPDVVDAPGPPDGPDAIDRPGDGPQPSDGLSALTRVDTDDRGCTVEPQVIPSALSLADEHVEDLDGDGLDDRVETWGAGTGAERRTFVRLVLGTGAAGALQEEFDLYEVLASPDLDGDGVRELLITRGGNTWTTGFVGYVDGCRVLGVTGPDGPEEYSWGVEAHSGGCPLCTATLTCAPVGARTTLVEAHAEPFDGSGSVSGEDIDAWRDQGDDRQWRWERRVLTYADGALVTADSSSGTDRHPDVPADVLRNTLTC